jgi:uncharacterized protein YjbJ (UPF0337 family)
LEEIVHSIHVDLPQRPHVTVLFGDGAHSFRLPKGATLAELAGCIDTLEAQHQAVPAAIYVTVGVSRSAAAFNPGVSQMNRERVKGAAQKIKGSIEAVVAKVIGNKRLETEGRIDKTEGAVRTALGNAKDAASGRTK